MGIAISKDSSVPLHFQLLNDKRYRILSRERTPRSRVASENTLVNLLNLSKSSIHLVLDWTKAETLIEGVAGKGTFIISSTRRQVCSRLIGFIILHFRTSFGSRRPCGAKAALRSQNDSVHLPL